MKDNKTFEFGRMAFRWCSQQSAVGSRPRPCRLTPWAQTGKSMTPEPESREEKAPDPTCRGMVATSWLARPKALTLMNE